MTNNLSKADCRETIHPPRSGRGGAGMEAGTAGELLPEFLFGFWQSIGHDDFGHDEKVAFTGEAASAHTEFGSAGGAAGDLDVHFARERGHSDFCPERSFPRREFKFVNEVETVHFKFRMFGEADVKVEIAAIFAASGEAQLLPFGDAGGNLDLMSFGPAIGLHGDGADASVKRFFERDEQVTFNIATGAAFGER